MASAKRVPTPRFREPMLRRWVLPSLPAVAYIRRLRARIGPARPDGEGDLTFLAPGAVLASALFVLSFPWCSLAGSRPVAPTSSRTRLAYDYLGSFEGREFYRSQAGQFPPQALADARAF